MSLLKSIANLLSSSKEAAPTPLYQEEYKGFLILATPAAEASQYRINGLISKEGKEHIFMRADVLPNQELCVQETFRKGRLMIDQQGEKIFQ
ncbi:HlyU family transcriptional regulator [Neptunomonas antarctica]|uniref:Uncharacterized protein n=1 Tax=Neptunomonas antarctica TaxID=619304 RepID=A0A1N7LL54_9GAMM|nr:HlyU family transcriptional regulator [Neptunomonas antarctica]SIS74563.1 hypothetical protein SAMN05421760_104123 [Neptunomonas antarctica]